MSAFFSVAAANLRFGGVIAVDDLSFSLEKGEYLGIIGPNGAGKTTLLNCISGVLRPTSGSIVLDSQSLIGRRPHRIAALGVARISYGPGPYRVAMQSVEAAARLAHASVEG